MARKIDRDAPLLFADLKVGDTVYTRIRKLNRDSYYDWRELKVTKFSQFMFWLDGSLSGFRRYDGHSSDSVRAHPATAEIKAKYKAQQAAAIARRESDEQRERERIADQRRACQQILTAIRQSTDDKQWFAYLDRQMVEQWGTRDREHK